MTDIYRHTQIGYVLTVILGSAFLLCLYLLRVIEPRWLLLLVVIVLGASLLSFPTMTVRIDQKVVEVRLGVGLIRRSFRLADIQDMKRVKNPWYAGWGIRRIQRGWLYRVAGLDAVELTMKDGQRYGIGTDAPQEFMQAIQKGKQ